jgi:hypothetical protein
MAESKKKINSKKRQTVPITSHVKIHIKSEIQHIADTEGLSVSQVSAAFLEEGLRQKYHVRHSILLQPIIEQTIKKEIAKYSQRQALLLVRANFDIGQVRSIVTNILGRQPGVTPEILTNILDQSAERARNNITRQTSQLKTILEEVAHWFTEYFKEK